MPIEPTASVSEAAAAGSLRTHPLLSRRYKTWLVVVLLIVSTFNFADRAVLSVLAQAIKEDLRFTDADLGMLQGLGFAILYSILGLPLGWLADRVSRKQLIAGCIAVWSFMSAACGFASSFTTMLLCRVGVGIGEAGFQPPAFSLLADHFGPNRRSTILAIMALGAPLGFLVGQSVGGWVAAAWNWRAAFVVLGAPGLIVALIVWFTLREPPRGLVEGRLAAGSPPSFKLVMAELFSKPSFRHLLIASTVSGFTYNAVTQFVLPFYLRGFGLPLALVGVVFGIIGFTSNSLGMILGGVGFDWLSKRDARWLMWGPGALFLLAMPLYAGAFASTQSHISFALIWLANFVAASYFAPTFAAVQNLAGPRMRSSATAVLTVVVGVIGAGFGPTVLGIISDQFAAAAFHHGNFIASCPGGHAPTGAASSLDVACRSASGQGLRRGLIWVQVVYIWAAFHYLQAARTFRQDLYNPGSDER